MQSESDRFSQLDCLSLMLAAALRLLTGMTYMVSHYVHDVMAGEKKTVILYVRAAFLGLRFCFVTVQ